LFIILIEKRSNSTLSRHDELLCPREHPIRPGSIGSLFVSDILLSSECMHDLLEISTLSVEESIDDRIRDSEVARVSPESFPISILDIDDPDEPVLFSLTISIDSTLHPDEVVGSGCLSSRIDGSILRSISELRESRRHIRDSTLDSMIRESSLSCRIRTSREDRLDGSGFWTIGSADSEVHRRKGYKVIGDDHL